MICRQPYAVLFVYTKTGHRSRGAGSIASAQNGLAAKTPACQKANGVGRIVATDAVFLVQ
jgi:hypothetical protein